MAERRQERDNFRSGVWQIPFFIIQYHGYKIFWTGVRQRSNHSIIIIIIAMNLLTLEEHVVSDEIGLKPLEGIRVLDFSRHMAGPYAGAILADYGADVIKIESMPYGDPARWTGSKLNGKVSGPFSIWNRGKRSMVLDMRKKEALEAVYRLAETADVVLENYKPGVVDKIGIGYEQLKKINPKLIYVSVSAFGRGPLEPFPGTDPVVQAMSGVMSVTGERGGAPVLVGVPIADFTGAMCCSQAVMLGLLARQKTGRGQLIEVSMLHALMSSLTTRLGNYWATGKDPERFGASHSVVMPYQAWQTSDGYVVAGIWNGANDTWPTFCQAVGLPELAQNPHYAGYAERLERRDELAAILQAEFIKQPTAYWEARFNELQVLFGPVYSFGEILAHPHVKQAGIVSSIQHPEAGEIPALTPAISLSETPGGIGRHPPLLGEHTREILAEAGYSAAEIDAFLAKDLGRTVDQVAATAKAKAG